MAWTLPSPSPRFTAFCKASTSSAFWWIAFIQTNLGVRASENSSWNRTGCLWKTQKSRSHCVCGKMWKWSLAAVWPRRGLRRINSAVPLGLRQKKKKKKKKQRLLGKSYKKFMRKPEGACVTLWRAHWFAVFDRRHGTGTVGESMSNWYHMPRCELCYLLFVQPCMFLSSRPGYKPLNAHKENTEQRVPGRTSPHLIDPVWKRGVWQTNGPPICLVHVHPSQHHSMLGGDSWV